MELDQLKTLGRWIIMGILYVIGCWVFVTILTWTCWKMGWYDPVPPIPNPPPVDNEQEDPVLVPWG